MADIVPSDTPNETSASAQTTTPPRWNWRDRLRGPGLWLGVFLVGVILFTRLFNLGLKPVQHDESMFAYYAYLITDKYENMPPAQGLLDAIDQYGKALGAYEYQPIMHGPVLEWGVSLVFWIFGNSDYTMRLLSALCSIGIMALLFAVRKQIGVRPAIWGVFLLAICPSFLYVSRSIRPDLPMLFTYLLIIFTGLKYRKKPTGLRMLALVVLLWFASCVHETYVIFYFFLGTFLFGCWLHGMVQRKAWNELAVGLGGLVILAALGIYALHDQPKVEAPRVSGGTPEPIDMKWSQFRPLMIFMILGAGALWFHSQRWKPDYRDIPFYHEFRKAIHPHGWAIIVGCMIGAYLSVALMTMNFRDYNPVDEKQNPIGPIKHLKLSYDNYLKTFPDKKTMASAATPATEDGAGDAAKVEDPQPSLINFLENYLNTNLKHWNGQYEAYIYWQGQNIEHRIGGAFHFHWLHMLFYEGPMTLFWAIALIATAWPRVDGPRRRMWRGVYLAILAALIALLFIPAWWTPDKTDHLWGFKFSPKMEKKIHMTLGFHVWLFFVPLILVMMAGWNRLSQGKYFHAFVDYWTVGSFLAYGYAGEKVPWLEAHIALPMMISLGFYISDFLDGALANLRPVPTVETAPQRALEPEPDSAAEPLSNEDVVAVPLPIPPTSAASTKRPPGSSSGKSKKSASGSASSGLKTPESVRASVTTKNPSKPKVKSIEKTTEPKAPPRSAVSFRPLLSGISGGGGFDLSRLAAIKRGDRAIIGYLAFAILFTTYILYVSCFRQPGSPVERHSYACSHTHYHQAITFLLNKIKNDPKVIEEVKRNREQIVKEGKRKPRDEYPTVIALEGTHEWPAHWQLRLFTKKTFPKVDAATTAEYVIIDNNIMASKPPYKERYEWSPPIRFRHYWVPGPLDVKNMFKFGLLLTSDKSLKPEQAEARKSMILSWKKLWTAYVLRDEEKLRNGGPLEWRELSGYEVYFGRKLMDPIPVQPAAAGN